ncbi:hypothetical protein AB9K35_17850 [Leisingera sp. XS_AS12]|uniref:hypothetical protein n=1 Tax=Leisingera sp. XS_AS12 TaxID=3241294 RepID=UPI00351163E4
MNRDFKPGPKGQRRPGAVHAEARNCNAIAADVLLLAGHDLLAPRLDGRRPIFGKITARMFEQNDADIVRRLTISAGQVELIRILDFKNKQGFHHFGVTAHSSLAEVQIVAFLKKVRTAFSAAVRIMQEREKAEVNSAVTTFLDAKMAGSSLISAPDQTQMQIGNQCISLADLKVNEIIS